jgi:hypothetical protein
MDEKSPNPTLEYFLGKMKKSAEEEAKTDAILAILPPEQREAYLLQAVMKEHAEMQELLGMFSHPKFPGKKKDEAPKPKAKALKSSRPVSKDEESNTATESSKSSKKNKK